MEEEKFLIHELAEKAGVTVRTIRYYTNEGLLPQPEASGKYAYYSAAHLNRLELIRRMKDAYLPLREIRQTLVRLSDSAWAASWVVVSEELFSVIRPEIMQA